MNQEKYRKLLTIIQRYRSVSVAFSGGVDSTLLLYAALEALGTSNVVSLFASSDLCSRNTVQNARAIIATNFDVGINFREIPIHPLEWQEFTQNDDDRCYICKRNTYRIFYGEAKKSGLEVLIDGTNVDDLRSHRPGLKAVSELNVKTPLVEAGITKKEIRELSRGLGLSNHELLSNSCLATRISIKQEITRELLLRIEKAEEYVASLGFQGSRVRVAWDNTILEVRNRDLTDVFKEENRIALMNGIEKVGLPNISIALKGRE